MISAKTTPSLVSLKAFKSRTLPSLSMARPNSVSYTSLRKRKQNGPDKLGHFADLGIIFIMTLITPLPLQLLSFLFLSSYLGADDRRKAAFTLHRRRSRCLFQQKAYTEGQIFYENGDNFLLFPGAVGATGTEREKHLYW